jgi:hypothetical protein
MQPTAAPKIYTSLRCDPALYRAIAEEATKNSRSLNREIESRLRQSLERDAQAETGRAAS